MHLRNPCVIGPIHSGSPHVKLALLIGGLAAHNFRLGQKARGLLRLEVIAIVLVLIFVEDDLRGNLCSGAGVRGNHYAAFAEMIGIAMTPKDKL